MVNSAPRDAHQGDGGLWQPCAPANREARGWGGGEGARVGEMGTWERVLGYVIDVGRLSVPMTVGRPNDRSNDGSNDGSNKWSNDWSNRFWCAQGLGSALGRAFGSIRRFELVKPAV